jgi:hypothetical protein
LGGPCTRKVTRNQGFIATENLYNSIPFNISLNASNSSFVSVTPRRGGFREASFRTSRHLSLGGFTEDRLYRRYEALILAQLLAIR